MIEQFLEVWKPIANQDFVYGLLQLESEIRADERRKFAEWLCKRYQRVRDTGFGVEMWQNIYWEYINEVIDRYEKEQKNDNR